LEQYQSSLKLAVKANYFPSATAAMLESSHSTRKKSQMLLFRSLKSLFEQYDVWPEMATLHGKELQRDEN
jgi:hypothetical protein